MDMFNEEQLRVFAEHGKFPVYLYWNAASRKFDFDTVERNDAFGSIWKNPFVEKCKTTVSVKITEREVCEKVNDAILSKIKVCEEKFMPSADLRNDLGIDSLESVEIIMNLEKTLGIEISGIEAEELHTVEDYQRICVRLLAETKSAK